MMKGSVIIEMLTKVFYVLKPTLILVYAHQFWSVDDSKDKYPISIVASIAQLCRKSTYLLHSMYWTPINSTNRYTRTHRFAEYRTLREPIVYLNCYIDYLNCSV